MTRIERVSRINRIAVLDAEELRGWIAAVVTYRVRDWEKGERAAVVRRAAVLGLSVSEVGL
jgi:hypothetical protein